MQVLELCSSHPNNDNNDNEKYEDKNEKSTLAAAATVAAKVVPQSQLKESLWLEKIQHKIVFDAPGCCLLVTQVKHNGQSWQMS